MLRASAAEDPFEGLRNYVLGNKRAPTDVPAARVRPRLETEPGDEVPGAPSVIPSSSQRPGKRTNDTVPYARLVFTEFGDSPADPTDILPGDVVLVYKTQNGLGHDTNRASKVASWRQLNAFFAAKAAAMSAGVVLDARHRDGIVAVREAASKALTAAIDATEEVNAAARGDVEARRDRMKEKRDVLDNSLKALKLGTPGTPPVDFFPEFDWQAVPFVSDWAADGVLISRDDDEQSASYFCAGPGESGTALNIAVQGPAFARNSGAAPTQVFDQSPMLLDDAYLLLMAILDSSGAAYSFQYTPTSGRILSELSDPARNWAAVPDRKYPSDDSGLSVSELGTVVHAWRIGRVMDVQAVKSPRMKVKLNVCISPMSRLDLVERFNKQGSTHGGVWYTPPP